MGRVCCPRRLSLEVTNNRSELITQKIWKFRRGGFIGIQKKAAPFHFLYRLKLSLLQVIVVAYVPPVGTPGSTRAPLDGEQCLQKVQSAASYYTVPFFFARVYAPEPCSNNDRLHAFPMNQSKREKVEHLRLLRTGSVMNDITAYARDGKVTWGEHVRRRFKPCSGQVILDLLDDSPSSQVMRTNASLRSSLVSR